MRLSTALILVALFAAPLAGCLNKSAVDAANVDQERADEILGKAGRDALIDAAAVIPKNYSFVEQQILPAQLREFVGTITNAANGALETEKDEGGIEHSTYVETQDITDLVPAGQPVELVIDLIWDASEANSADLDIVVDVPGLRSSFSPTSETFNWNLAVKTLVVNTVGVAGQPAMVGVQAAGGAVSEGFDYTLRVHAQYVKDVLTPHHPWAFDVPAEASGLIIESEKAGGEEHVAAQFIIVDPTDELVAFVDFNDIDIPTESVFIPTKKPGTYVFYAYSMHGGFLRVKADVPLDNTQARALAIVETKVVDSTAPAPGVAGKDFLNGTLAQGTIPQDDQAPTTVDFDSGTTFPLKVVGYITGTAHSQSKITLTSPLGVVHTLTKMARYEDGSGSVGYTGHHEGSPNNLFDWQNIQRGAWTAKIVNTSPGAEIGHVIVTYARG